MTPTFRLEHETVLVDYFIESVAPRHDVRENGFEYDKHFVSTDAGGFTAYLVGLFHYFLFCQFKMITFLFADGVITFSSLAKQSAQTSDTSSATEEQPESEASDEAEKPAEPVEPSEAEAPGQPDETTVEEADSEQKIDAPEEAGKPADASEEKNE